MTAGSSGVSRNGSETKTWGLSRRGWQRLRDRHSENFVVPLDLCTVNIVALAMAPKVKIHPIKVLPDHPVISLTRRKRNLAVSLRVC